MAYFGEGISAGANKPGFLDRAAADAKGMVSGFFPGLLHMGKTIASDPIRGLQGKSFKSDNLVKDMATGFWDDTFWNPLIQGKPGQAWDRFLRLDELRQELASENPQVGVLVDLEMNMQPFRTL